MTGGGGDCRQHLGDALRPALSSRWDRAASRVNRYRMNAWPALLKRTTLAKYLEVSLPSLEKELAAGRLPRPIMFGGTLHWRRSEVDKMIEASTLDPAADARKQFEQNLDRLRNRAA